MSGGGGLNFGGLGAGSTMAISGGYDLTKANKLEKKLGKRPLYVIPEPTIKNTYIAENRAQQGLSDASLQVYTQNADRGLSSSLDAILKSGGGVNSVSDLYSGYNDSLSKIALMDDQARFQNQQLLMAQNSLMADELDKQWQLNIFAPWSDEKQRIAELRALGNAKKMGGASVMAGASGGNGYNQPRSEREQTQQVMNSGGAGAGGGGGYGGVEFNSGGAGGSGGGGYWNGGGAGGGGGYWDGGTDANLNYHYRDRQKNYILGSMYA